MENGRRRSYERRKVIFLLFAALLAPEVEVYILWREAPFNTVSTAPLINSLPLIIVGIVHHTFSCIFIMSERLRLSSMANLEFSYLPRD
jgi:hypothetical protein